MSRNIVVSVKEKIAYGLGDTASNFVWQTVLLFQLYFYTDIFKLPPALIGVLFLAVRIFDAVTDPLMGAWTDKVQTRYGKYRPFLLWLAVPFGIITVLAFSVPDMEGTPKVIYAFVTYTLLMAMYTAINIPYCALGGVLTGNASDRVSIQTWRFVFGMLGGFIVALFTEPLALWFGDGDKASGFQYAMMVMAAMGIVFFLICFAGTRERVAPPKEQNSRIRDDLKALVKNDQWRILCAIATFLLIGILMRTQPAAIYADRVLVMDDLVIGGMTLGKTTQLLTIGMIGNILGVMLASPISKRFCKIRAFQAAQILAAIVSALGFFIAPEQVWLTLGAWFAFNFVLQIGTPLLWAKMADVVDYGHLKTGIRVNATVYSTIIFFIKMGVALGGAIAAFLLAFYGYDADAEMTDEIRDGITISFTLYPAIAFLIVAWIASFYKLTDERVQEIQAELPELEPAE